MPPFSLRILDNLIIILSVYKQSLSGDCAKIPAPSIFSPLILLSEYFFSLLNLLLFKY